MGHGLNMFYGHDLPRALHDCDWLHDAWEREACYGGAFMENIMHATAPHHPATLLAGRREHASAPRFRPLDPDDPLYPCSIMARKYLSACYQIQTAAMLQLNQGDIADAARSCDRAPRAMRGRCYQSLGRDISAYARHADDEAIRLCTLGSERYRAWCYVGLVKSLIDWTMAPERGFAFCRKVSGVDDKARCYEAVGEQVAALQGADAERAALCQRAEGVEYVDACRFGARLVRRSPLRPLSSAPRVPPAP
jgi:hypothetical protein